MRDFKKIFWGISFIIIGVIIALNQLNITDINVFFKGWWTLFIIVPSIFSLVQKKNMFSSLITLLIGIILLFILRGLISYELLSVLLVPAVFILIGIYILFNNGIKNKITEKFIEAESSDYDSIIATFSENNKSFAKGEKFKNTKIDVTFASVSFDVRLADLKKINHINSSAIFGGVKIFVPEDVNVVLKSTNIFGGSTSKIKNNPDNKKTIYVNSFCLFGGMEIV